MARWEPDFDFYDADLEGTLVAVFLDLGASAHAPVATHPLRFQVRIALALPRPDGLHGAEEHEMLINAEDAMAKKLAESIDAIYVGRLVAEGFVTFTFYVPKAHEAALREPRTLIGDGVPYQLEWNVADDAEWRYYRELLWPDAETEKAMKSRRVADRVLGVGQA
jgi:Family of unknown function (DUF695)